MSRTHSIACALGLALAVATVPARADLSRHSNAIAGERPLGLGGAFTGLADSPAAAYYNPAGLAHLPRRSASVSLSLQVVERLRIDDAYMTTAGPADIDSRGTPVLPIFSSVVSKFGRRDAEGMRRFAFAFTTVQPNRSSWQAVIDRRSDDPAIQDSLVVSQSYRDLWYGLSLAYRISPRYAVGLTAFLATRDFRHTEGITRIEEGMLDPARGTFENPYFTVTDTLAEYDAWHMLVRAGALARPTNWLQIGAMVQSPGIQVRGEGRVRERTNFANLVADPGYATFYLSDQAGLPVDVRIPWQARLGLTVYASDTLLLTGDVDVTGAYGSVSTPTRPIDIDDLEDANGRPPDFGFFVPRELSHRWSANAAIGAEWRITTELPLRIGFFTNFASSTPIPSAPDVYHAPQVDYYGGTFALGYARGDYDLTLGVAGRYGTGAAVGYNPDNASTSYFETQAESWALHIFIGGYRRAATTLVRDVGRRIRDRRRQDRNDEVNNEDSPSSDQGSDSAQETP